MLISVKVTAFYKEKYGFVANIHIMYSNVLAL